MRFHRLLFFSLLVSIVLLLYLAANASAVQVKNVAVSRVDATSAVLVVKGDVPFDVTVDYGQAPGTYIATWSGTGTTRYEAPLAGLAPSSTVYYRVTMNDTANPAASVILPESSFHTARAAGQPFTYTVAGDNRPWTDTVVEPVVWGTIVGQMLAEAPDLSINVGDMIYGLNTDTLSQALARYDGFFATTTPLTKTAPLYTVVGSHEWLSWAPERAAYEQELTLPRNNGANAATDGEEYYSYDVGDTHFVVLCTELPGQYGLITGNQKLWLQQDLAATTKRWKVVSMHQPLFGFSGIHNGDPWATATNTAGQQNRTETIALFKQYGVSVVFSGHDHYYFHHVEDGVQYVITGGGGAPPYPVPALGPGDIYGNSTYEHVKVDETADSMKLSAIDSAGALLESFTLGTPKLQLSQTRAYWASYADYVARDLSVDCNLGNAGPGDAADVQIVWLQATNGVAPLDPMPLTIGGIGAGSTKPLTLHYLVPGGVQYFRATTFATCADLSGNTYYYPGPAPVI